MEVKLQTAFSHKFDHSYRCEPVALDLCTARIPAKSWSKRYGCRATKAALRSLVDDISKRLGWERGLRRSADVGWLRMLLKTRAAEAAKPYVVKGSIHQWGLTRHVCMRR